MNRTFWVTLRNAPLYITLAAEKWCEENNVTDIEINQAELTLSHISFSFANDTDAMLFKLTWSDYL
jgi:hypothetical protein